MEKFLDFFRPLFFEGGMIQPHLTFNPRFTTTMSFTWTMSSIAIVLTRALCNELRTEN